MMVIQYYYLYYILLLFFNLMNSQLGNINWWVYSVLKIKYTSKLLQEGEITKILYGESVLARVHVFGET
jgi:hypothetical protein